MPRRALSMAMLTKALCTVLTSQINRALSSFRKESTVFSLSCTIHHNCNISHPPNSGGGCKSLN